MLNYKDVLNEAVKHDKEIRPLTQEESEALKAALFDMAVDLDERCRKNNIHMFLVGGSVLGAVRHGGFIPWDDDMDFGLRRDEYERIKTIFDSEFGDMYDLRCPRSAHPNGNRFMQIYKKGTVLKSIESNPLQPEAIGIDIFPYDYVPEGVIHRYLKGTVANAKMFIASCVMDWTYQSGTLKRMMYRTIKGRVLFRLRMLVGRLFSFRKPEEWFDSVDNTIFYRKTSKLVTSATGRKHYLGEIYPKEVFFPLKKLQFNNHRFYAPAQSKVYLRGLYGDSYMVVPAKEKRESHFVRELKL